MLKSKIKNAVEIKNHAQQKKFSLKVKNVMLENYIYLCNFT